MMDFPRSTLSSPRGKRRILVQQDSTGPDPPKKSPIHRSAPVSFATWDCAWPSNPWNSTFTTPFAPFGGSPTHQRATTTHDVPCSDPPMPPPSAPASRAGAASSAGFTATGGRRPMLGLIGRGNSKDLMDSYFAMKRSRRRSSCKEITLMILQEDAWAPTTGNSAPQFKTVESRRRVSIAPALSCDDVLEVQEPGELDVAGVGSNLERSLSADAYDAGAKQEARQETQALLFDSVPDLTDTDNYDRFPTLRHYRRGAVCYDPDLATSLLTNLSIKDDDDEEL